MNRSGCPTKGFVRLIVGYNCAAAICTGISIFIPFHSYFHRPPRHHAAINEPRPFDQRVRVQFHAWSSLKISPFVWNWMSLHFFYIVRIIRFPQIYLCYSNAIFIKRDLHLNMLSEDISKIAKAIAHIQMRVIRTFRS